MALYTGPASALIAELFPTRVRSTGTAITYGLAVAIFGGFTPAIISALVNYTGNKLSVALWLMAAAAISFVALIFVKDRSRQELV
jgi:MHS family proline/betaine transporter-like MFS transporter